MMAVALPALLWFAISEQHSGKMPHCTRSIFVEIKNIIVSILPPLYKSHFNRENLSLLCEKAREEALLTSSRLCSGRRFLSLAAPSTALPHGGRRQRRRRANAPAGQQQQPAAAPGRGAESRRAAAPLRASPSARAPAPPPPALPSGALRKSRSGRSRARCHGGKAKRGGEEPYPEPPALPRGVPSLGVPRPGGTASGSAARGCPSAAHLSSRRESSGLLARAAPAQGGRTDGRTTAARGAPGRRHGGGEGGGGEGWPERPRPVQPCAHPGERGAARRVRGGSPGAKSRGRAGGRVRVRGRAPRDAARAAGWRAGAAHSAWRCCCCSPCRGRAAPRLRWVRGTEQRRELPRGRAVPLGIAAVAVARETRERVARWNDAPQPREARLARVRRTWASPRYRYLARRSVAVRARARSSGSPGAAPGRVPSRPSPSPEGSLRRSPGLAAAAGLRAGAGRCVGGAAPREPRGSAFRLQRLPLLCCKLAVEPGLSLGSDARASLSVRLFSFSPCWAFLLYLAVTVR